MAWGEVDEKDILDKETYYKDIVELNTKLDKLLEKK
jgi:hypothetical protein